MIRVPNALSALGQLTETAGEVAMSGALLARAGALHDVRGLHRLPGVAVAVGQWGMVPATGYALAAARTPQRAAVIDDAGTLTFEQVHSRSSRLAGALLARQGDPRSRIGLLARNHRGFIETLLAAEKSGIDVVLINAFLSASQLAEVVTDNQISILVLDAEFAALSETLPPAVQRIWAWNKPEADDRGPAPRGPAQPGEDLEQLIAQGDPHAGRNPRHCRMIVLTSGTTGTPKGAIRPTTRPLHAVNALMSRIPLRAGRTMLISGPLFHTWGLSGWQLAALLGSTVVLRRRFEPADTLRVLSVHGCHQLIAVPVMAQRLADLPASAFEQYPAPQLEAIVCSGSAIPTKHVIRIGERFGPVLYNLYGSTEVSWVTIADPADLAADPATAGRAPANTRLAILDDRGEPVPEGEVGRIFVGHRMLFEGYIAGSHPQQIDDMVDTGDLGRIRDGLLFVTGRGDDMVITGGENVHPAEVEEVLSGFPGVREAAVLGVPDDDLGQRLVAYVVTDPQAGFDPDRAKEHLRSALARFAVPRQIEIVEQLPRNPAGKVLRRDLLARHTAKKAAS